MKINTNSQYYSALAKIERCIEKGVAKPYATRNGRPSKNSIAAEAYEMQKYPMPLPAGIKEILEHYMSENKINKTQLEIPNSTLSEIMNGKKS